MINSKDKLKNELGASEKKERELIDKSELRKRAKAKKIKFEDVVKIRNYKETYETNEEVLEKLEMGNNIKSHIDGRCHFYDEYKATVKKFEDTGKLYYYSEGPNGSYFILSFFDFVDIFLNKGNYGEAITKLIKFYGFKTGEENRKAKDKDTLNRNIETIKRFNRANGRLKKEYPALWKFLKPAFNTWIEMNNINIEFLSGDMNTTRSGEPAFFISYSHLANRIGISELTAKKHIARLTLVGLVKKEWDNLSEELREKAIVDKNINNKASITNHYTITTVTDETLCKANEIAEIAIENRMDKAEITKNRVEEVFGKELAERMFPEINYELFSSVENNTIEIEFIINKVKSIPGTNLKKIKADILGHQEEINVPKDFTLIVSFKNDIRENEIYKGIGKWVKYERLGWRFLLFSAEAVWPENFGELKNYLVEQYKSIGKNIAKKIVDKFGQETKNIFEGNIEKLHELEGLRDKKFEIIKKEVEEKTTLGKIKKEFLPVILSNDEINTLRKKMKDFNIKALKENPYETAKEEIFDFKKADEMAKILGFESSDKRRIQQAIREFLKSERKNKGNIFCYKKEIKEHLSSFLYKIGDKSYDRVEITAKEINEAINYLASKNEIRVRKDENDEIIYFKFYLEIEDKLVEMITDRVQREYEIDEKKYSEYLLRNHNELGIEQKQAIEQALKNGISIITGGAGVGKTHTIKHIYKIIREIEPGVTIALASPTGKAANILSIETGDAAKTIHRLIDLKPTETKTEEEMSQNLRKVEADFVIVDEMSMTDIYVFYCLLKSLKLDSKLILVGDYNQLPSVGPGLVFRDLILSKRVRTTFLTEIYRQNEGNEIIDNANKIIDGKKNLIYHKYEKTSDFKKGDFFLKNIDKPKGIAEEVTNCMKGLLELEYDMDDIQIITSINKGKLGVKEINNNIQENFNPSMKIIKVKNRILKKGDKVIQNRNNSKLGVYNGEIGRVTKVGKEYVEVEFGDKIIKYTKEIGELDLAYVTTVHKFQGSQAKVIILLVHSSQNFIYRNLIYTAITRATEKVIILGEEEYLKRGIRETDNIQRNSKIIEKLQDKLPVRLQICGNEQLNILRDYDDEIAV